MAVKIGNRLAGPQNSVVPPAAGSVRKTFVDFLRAVRAKDDRTLEKDFQTGWVAGGPGVVRKTAMAESSGSTGGYIVPPGFTHSLMQAFAEESFIYPRATVIPMDERTIQCPKMDIETAQSAGVAPYFSGMQFLWQGETTISETEPKFRQLELTAWDLTGYCTVSNQFLNDLGDTGEEYLLKLFGRAAAYYAEYAFFQGTGAPNQMPLGIINAPGSITVTAATGGAIVIADITGVTQKLLPYSWKNAVWACHPTALNKIQQLSQYYINIEVQDGKGPGSLCGMLSTRPLFVTDKLPALGSSGSPNAGCVVLFDPTLYAIGQRAEVFIDISEHTLFQNYQSVFRVWLRIDGRPIVSKAVTLTDGTATASPYVILSA